MMRSRLLMPVMVAAAMILSGPSVLGQCQRTCSKEKAAACSDKAAKCPVVQKADELMAKWSQVPDKLASMSKEDMTTLVSARKSLFKANPGLDRMEPSMQYLGQAMRLLVALDDQVCGNCQNCAKVKAVACEKTFERWETRHDLTTTAARLYLTALGTMTADSGDTKTGCDWACMGAPEATSLKLASATCSASKQTDAAKAACSKSKQAGEDKTVAAKTGCSKSETSCKSAMAVADAGCTKSKAACASKCGSACQPMMCNMFKSAETLAQKADAATMASGMLMADLQEGASLAASMDKDSAASYRECYDTLTTQCPVGSLLPETLATVHALLAESAKLDACFANTCDKNPKVAEAFSDEVRQAYEARCRLTVAVLNVIDKLNGCMAPAAPAAVAAK